MTVRNDDPPRDDGGFESFCDEFDKFGLSHLFNDEQSAAMCEWIWRKIGAAYHDGRMSAFADAAEGDDYWKSLREGHDGEA
jgi:hypothetical protein